ncbi:unnamed protein product [Dimorphilus gyrociliatus]|uniref:Uncharacterized protein n=1 Tax=Dimorphilus gyrociliatus TaxID=2664684 RepID=A0A7I8WB15_9ANNE|nr:unnamed protein product [Dimorphilus gyrociliatus]
MESMAVFKLKETSISIRAISCLVKEANILMKREKEVLEELIENFERRINGLPCTKILNKSGGEAENFNTLESLRVHCKFIIESVHSIHQNSKALSWTVEQLGERVYVLHELLIDEEKTSKFLTRMAKSLHQTANLVKEKVASREEKRLSLKEMMEAIKDLIEMLKFLIESFQISTQPIKDLTKLAEQAHRSLRDQSISIDISRLIEGLDKSQRKISKSLEGIHQAILNVTKSLKVITEPVRNVTDMEKCKNHLEGYMIHLLEDIMMSVKELQNNLKDGVKWTKEMIDSFENANSYLKMIEKP